MMNLKELFSEFLPNRKKDNLKIAIYGQYKTGTTACFLKIKDSLKVAPREIFEAPKYHPHNKDKNKPLLAKVIIPPNPYILKDDFSPNISPEVLKKEAEKGLQTFKCFDKHILLTRDPRDWLVSGAMFIPQSREEIFNNKSAINEIITLLQKKEKFPRDVSLLDFFKLLFSLLNLSAERDISTLISDQHRYVIEFENKLDNYVRWSYEDMINNINSRIEEYLGIGIKSITDTNSRFEHTVRTKASGNWRNWFTDEDVTFFRPLLSGYMNHFAYKDNWALNKNPVINPTHVSKYVLKTIAMKHSQLRSAQK